MQRGPRDWVRAGALAAGIATLLGVFLQGVERSGYFGQPDIIGLGTMAASFIGVLIAIELGYREPLPSLWRRVLITPLVALAIGGLEIGLAFLHPVAERNMPPIYAVLGIAMVAIGLRRLPSHRAARVALYGVAGLLVSLRLLITFPTVKHALERRLVPVPEAMLRTAWDTQWCSSQCRVAKTVSLTYDVHSSACCYLERTERKVGDRFAADAGGTFVFFERKWQEQ